MSWPGHIGNLRCDNHNLSGLMARRGSTRVEEPIRDTSRVRASTTRPGLLFAGDEELPIGFAFGEAALAGGLFEGGFAVNAALLHDFVDAAGQWNDS